MKEFIGKLTEKLDELISDTYHKSVSGSMIAGIENNAYHNAKEIIKQCAEEYELLEKFEQVDAVKSATTTWIPVSERLPEERDSIFSKLKGTDKWNSVMFEKTSDVVNVTVADESGKAVTTHAHTIDGKWCCVLLRANKSYRITAWQSLPEAYSPKGERR